MSQRRQTAASIQHHAREQIATQMRELLPDGSPLFPTPIEAVEKVLRRLEEAWEATAEAPPIVRSARMVQVIEAFARYTGIEVAVELLRQKAQLSAGPWREQLERAGWKPPPEEQVLPGLPAPEKPKEPAEGVKVIEVDE